MVGGLDSFELKMPILRGVLLGFLREANINGTGISLTFIYHKINLDHSLEIHVSNEKTLVVWGI